MIYLFMSLGIEDLKGVELKKLTPILRKKVTDLLFKELLGCFSS
jgi:hypothetical protein